MPLNNLIAGSRISGLSYYAEYGRDQWCWPRHEHPCCELDVVDEPGKIYFEIQATLYGKNQRGTKRNLSLFPDQVVLWARRTTSVRRRRVRKHQTQFFLTNDLTMDLITSRRYRSE